MENIQNIEEQLGLSMILLNALLDNPLITGVVIALVSIIATYFSTKRSMLAALKKSEAEADSIKLKDVIELRKYNKEQIDELIKDNEETKALLKVAREMVEKLTKQSDELQRKVNIYQTIINARD